MSRLNETISQTDMESHEHFTRRSFHMNIFHSLSQEVSTGDSQEIESIYNALVSKANSQPNPSFESTNFSNIFASIFKSIKLMRSGNYVPDNVKTVMFDKIKVDNNWLTIKEIVVEIPVTVKYQTLDIVFGHILKSKETLLHANDTVANYKATIAGYVSNPNALSPISGVESTLDPKFTVVSGIPALNKMVDINTPSRVKLERLFNSLSNINVSVQLLNDLNRILANIDLVELNRDVERISELLSILSKDAKDIPSRNSLNTIIKDTGVIASLISDVAHIVTVTDVLTRSFNEVEKALY